MRIGRIIDPKNILILLCILICIGVAILFIELPQQQSIKNNPLDFNMQIDKLNFQYLGAFRFPSKILGDSRVAYSSGVFTLGKNNESVFITGNLKLNGIAEFDIPTLSLDKNIEHWSYATPIQPFINFLSNKLDNPQRLNRVSGMDFIEEELFVNAVEYYDAAADNTESTFIVRTPADLRNSKVNGFFSFKHKVHSAGWISKIPKQLQQQLNGSYLVGNASNIAINSRLSIGPSAFATYLDSFAGIEVRGGLIPSVELMNFSLKHKLHDDFYNESGTNDLWTVGSRAVYGFIVPNTNHYLVLGNSRGHKGGLGYKATQDNGHKCGGPCSLLHDDVYNYFWLFDVQDFIKVKSGMLKPFDIRPIKRGVLKTAQEQHNHYIKVIGADFDFENDLLYLLMANADTTQNKYEPIHVMNVYKLNIE